MIPCLNEETTLPLVLKDLPKSIKGIDTIETLLIDDGCTDGTVEVAKKYGVKNFLIHKTNMGLSRSFRHGLHKSLEMGADIIVLTEGDNQYPSEKIPDLVEPILAGRADLVIADRQTHKIQHFTPFKKFVQKFGTGVLNLLAGTNVPDAISGFRAYSKKAALDLNPVANYSWATETTIQAGFKGQKIEIIKIDTNAKTRNSRQFKYSWQHIWKSAITIIRSFVMYKPYVLFLSLGTILFIAGLVPFVHYLILVFTVKNPYGPHHLQSLVIGTVLLNAAFISFTLGFIADLIRINRSLLEDILGIVKRDHLVHSKKK
jgi:glycosyltransferase involved in cell wall biosynthesis